MENFTVGFALTGSYCTFEKVIPQAEKLCQAGYRVIPIMSENAQKTDTRFGKAKDFIDTLERITKNPMIRSIEQAEPIGPKQLIQALVVAPCTGNTLAKMALGITDTTVTMAAKSTLRNNCPVLIAISTNDGLSAAAKNIGHLQNYRNLFFVPYRQDDTKGKPRSLVADMNLILPTLNAAIKGEQLQPMLLIP